MAPPDFVEEYLRARPDAAAALKLRISAAQAGARRDKHPGSPPTFIHNRSVDVQSKVPSNDQATKDQPKPRQPTVQQSMPNNASTGHVNFFQMPGGPGPFPFESLPVQLNDEQQAYRRRVAEVWSKYRENGGGPLDMRELNEAALRTKEQAKEHEAAAKHGKKYDDMIIKMEQDGELKAMQDSETRRKLMQDETLMYHAQQSWVPRISKEQMKGDEDDAQRLRRVVAMRQKMMQDPRFWVKVKHLWETACPEKQAKEGVLAGEKLGNIMGWTQGDKMGLKDDFMEKILVELEHSKKKTEQQATHCQHQEHMGDPDWVMVNEEDEYVKVNIRGGKGDKEQTQQQAQPTETSAAVDPVVDWEVV